MRLGFSAGGQINFRTWKVLRGHRSGAMSAKLTSGDDAQVQFCKKCAQVTKAKKIIRTFQAQGREAARAFSCAT